MAVNQDDLEKWRDSLMDEKRETFAKEGWLAFIVFLTVSFVSICAVILAIIAEFSSKKSKERPTWMDGHRIVVHRMGRPNS